MSMTFEISERPVDEMGVEAVKEEIACYQKLRETLSKRELHLERCMNEFRIRAIRKLMGCTEGDIIEYPAHAIKGLGTISRIEYKVIAFVPQGLTVVGRTGTGRWSTVKELFRVSNDTKAPNVIDHEE